VTEVVIRGAEFEDAEGFVRAHDAAWDATVGQIVGRRLSDLASFDERVARYRAGFVDTPADAGLWVAERGGEIVGLAVRIGSELRDLYVVPEAWGTGVARSLVDAVFNAMRAEGEGEATLWVGEENARARRFYEREGWEPTGETRESPLGPSEARYRIQLAP
jgi:GNAT superfamily N-acetyltransferase